MKNLVNESPNSGTAIAAKTLATTTEYGRDGLDEESEVIDDVTIAEEENYFPSLEFEQDLAEVNSQDVSHNMDEATASAFAEAFEYLNTENSDSKENFTVSELVETEIKICPLCAKMMDKDTTQHQFEEHVDLCCENTEQILSFSNQ